MVRHEAAVALGSIGGDRSREVLSLYVAENSVQAGDQDEAIVIESCMVALESLGYWENPTMISS
jgi:deoxyhypusine monooxygenase